MLSWVSRLVVLAAGAFGIRGYARDFVREYIRELVRERLRAGLFIPGVQLALLAATAFAVHRLGDVDRAGGWRGPRWSGRSSRTTSIAS